ncbi:hypothetical protein ES703_98943 [subsurface metagenome]
MAKEAYFILLLTREAIFVVDFLCCVSHMVAIKYLPQPIEYHEVYKLVFSAGVDIHPVAPPGLGEDVGGMAHALHSSGNHNFRVTEHDCLCSQDDSLQARGAHFVHRVHGRLFGNAGSNSCLASRVLALPSLEDIPHDDLINLNFL